MKGSLWSKNAAAAQFGGLWHFSNKKVNTFIYGPKTAVSTVRGCGRLATLGNSLVSKGKHNCPEDVLTATRPRFIPSSRTTFVNTV